MNKFPDDWMALLQDRPVVDKTLQQSQRPGAWMEHACDLILERKIDLGQLNGDVEHPRTAGADTKDLQSLLSCPPDSLNLEDLRSAYAATAEWRDNDSLTPECHIKPRLSSGLRTKRRHSENDLSLHLAEPASKVRKVVSVNDLEVPAAGVLASPSTTGRDTNVRAAPVSKMETALDPEAIQSVLGWLQEIQAAMKECGDPSSTRPLLLDDPAVLSGSSTAVSPEIPASCQSLDSWSELALSPTQPNAKNSEANSVVPLLRAHGGPGQARKHRTLASTVAFLKSFKPPLERLTGALTGALTKR